MPNTLSSLININLKKLNFSFQSLVLKINNKSGREIAPNTGANVTKFFTLATKS